MSGQNEPVKVVSLNNIKVVKDYIDKVRGELTGRIDTLTEDYLNDKLNEAQQAIMDAYREDSKELRDRIAYVEMFGETFPGELQKLKLQLNTLEGDTQDKFDAIDAIGTQVDILSGKYDDLYEGITLGTIFNAGQLDEIIKTAMINEVMISSDQILTPEMYASKVVALIANFGKVKAVNIEAGTIAGSSIQSTNTIDGLGEPVWAINNEGSGWLACKNIEWDADGTVRFGKDVKLTWDSISDGQSTLDTVLNNYDKTVQDYVQDYVYDHTEGAATQNELKKAYDDAIKAVDEAKNSITATYDEQVAALYTALSTTETALRTDFQAKDEELTAALNGAKQGLEEAIKAGDEETANKYKELIAQLELNQKALENSFAQQNNAIKSLEDKFSQQENALDPTNLSEILAAALVTETEVGSDYVKTPNILAKEITALLGTFGEVNANDINANTIEGFTVQSPTAVRDEDGYLIYDYETVVNPSTGVPEQIPLGIRRKNPTWRLDYDGSGFVGRGNTKSDTWEQDGITWDAEGKITLGENVTIKWNKVDGGQDAVNTAKNEAVYTANTALNTELTNLKNTEINAINDNLNSLENKYNDLNTNLNNNVLDIQNKLNAAVSDAVLTPEELNDINIEYTAINDDYNKLKSAIDELNALIKDWQDGKLTITIPSTGEDDEDTTITVPNVDAPKSLIDYSELTAAYNKAKDVCEYYNGSTVSKDANGYLIISEDYPLNAFNNYYTAQTNALQDYNREYSYYTSFNRFGSKTTYIGANGIYSGTITGDNIVGGTISGLTVQSGTIGKLSDDTTGPYWQINNQGAGYLAKKNIQWEDNGDITITGNTTITGENVSINGDVKINGNAIISGIVTDAQESFESLVASTIEADTIIGDTIVGKTIQSSETDEDGNPSWQLNPNGSAYFCNNTIQMSNDTGLGVGIIIDRPDRYGVTKLGDSFGFTNQSIQYAKNPKLNTLTKDYTHPCHWNVSFGGGCAGFPALISNGAALCVQEGNNGLTLMGRPYSGLISFNNVSGGYIAGLRTGTVKLSMLKTLTDNMIEDSNSYELIWPDWVYETYPESVVYNDNIYTICSNIYYRCFNYDTETIDWSTVYWDDLVGINNIICDIDLNITIVLKECPYPGDTLNIWRTTDRSVKVKPFTGSYHGNCGLFVCDSELIADEAAMEDSYSIFGNNMRGEIIFAGWCDTYNYNNSDDIWYLHVY